MVFVLMFDGYLAFGYLLDTTVIYFTMFFSISTIISAVFMILTQLEIFQLTQNESISENTRLDAEKERFLTSLTFKYRI